MNIGDRAPFINYLTEQAAKYDKNLTPEKVELYWKYMQKYSLDEVKRGFEANEQDEKYCRWPTVTILEILINKQLSHKGHQNLYTCQLHSFEGDHKACGKPAQVNVRDTDNPLFVCHEHYELHREKSDIDKEVDKRAAEFEEKAKELGMTNRAYFFKLRGKTVANTTPKEVQEMENREAMTKIFETYSARRKKSKENRPRAPIDWHDSR